MYGSAAVDLLKFRVFPSQQKESGQKEHEKQLKKPKIVKNSASSLHATNEISLVA
jgi:hypothetical protein